MGDTVSVSVRVSKAKAKKVEQLAKATERPKSWIVEQALDAYLDANAWQVAHIQKGLADLKAGKAVEHERVAAWLKTWGGSREGKPPR